MFCLVLLTEISSKYSAIFMNLFIRKAYASHIKASSYFILKNNNVFYLTCQLFSFKPLVKLYLFMKNYIFPSVNKNISSIF